MEAVFINNQISEERKLKFLLHFISLIHTDKTYRWLLIMCHPQIHKQTVDQAGGRCSDMIGGLKG